MARPLRITYPGAFYHVTTRGNERGNVFKSRRDREKFLSYLESATIRYGAKIHAYCLMSNHFHLLLETPQGNLSEIMQHINGAYTTHFNVKRKRVGHLFQGRFKAILVEADEYASELSRYIHLNPVRAGMASKPGEYPWSSYHEYIGNTAVPEWLSTDFILGSFAGNAVNARKKYQLFVEDLIGKEYESPLKSTFGSSILGSQPPEFLDAKDAKNKMRQWVGEEPRFHPHVAHHDFEAWLLPYWVSIQRLAGHNKKVPTGKPETINHGNPPAYRIKEIFEIGTCRDSYIKPRDAGRILSNNDLSVAVGECPELKSFVNTIISVCGGVVIP